MGIARSGHPEVVAVEGDGERADRKDGLRRVGELAYTGDVAKFAPRNILAFTATTYTSCSPTTPFCRYPLVSVAGFPNSFCAFSLIAAVHRRRIASCGNWSPSPRGFSHCSGMPVGAGQITSMWLELL